MERSQEGGISVARGSFDGRCSVDGASEAMRNCTVAVEGANGGVGVAHVADGAAGEALVVGVGVVFGQGGIEADGRRDKGACDGGECGGCGCEGDGGDGANSDEHQIVFGCDLIAQSTFLPRGDSGGGSVCDDKRHGNGIGNDCRDGGDDSYPSFIFVRFLPYRNRCMPRYIVVLSLFPSLPRQHTNSIACLLYGHSTP